MIRNRQVSGTLAAGSFAALFLIGCSTAPQESATAPQSATAAAGTGSSAPSTGPTGSDSEVALASELQPGTYAAVVTSDLVLRSQPGTAPESEIFPDTLNEPMTVYVADGPVEADGYAWFLVEGIRDGVPVGPWSGWVAAGGKDGEVWLQPLGHAGGSWTLDDGGAGPTGIDPGSAAMTPGGLALLVGAPEFGAGDPHPQAWTYDVATSTWREIATSGSDRRGARSTATEDGLVFVFDSAGGALQPGLAGVYDTETDRWSWLDSVPPDFGLPVTGADGRIYLVGRDAVHRYDRETETWETIPVDMEHWFIGSALAMDDGSILVVADGGPIGRIDVEAAEFEVIAEPRMTRYDAASVIGPDGRLYLVGGSVQGMGATCGPRQMPDQSLFAMRLVEAYDFDSDEWSTLAPLPMSLSQPSVHATDTGIVVLGAETDGSGQLRAAHLELPGIDPDEPLAEAGQDDPESRGCGG